MSSEDHHQQPDPTDALSEGRRIYVGNLLYSLGPGDIEKVLRDSGFPHYEKIHISIDPVSGRNPGYCFVEFHSSQDAEEALSRLGGVLVQDRPLKVGPCHPKSTPRSARRPWADRGQLAFDRWGDWTPEKRRPAEPEEQGPYGALQHHAVETAALHADGRHTRRLYIGGMGKMYDQAHNQAEMKEILRGFNYVAIGKRITPKHGGHHYCFVDFPTAEEAERVIRALNGVEWQGWPLVVQHAKGLQPPRNGQQDSQDSKPEGGEPWGASSRGYDDRRGRDRDQGQWSEGRAQGAWSSSRNQGDWSSGRNGQGGRGGAKREDREEREARQRAILAANSWRSPAPAQ
ncbi:hypothetical protein VTJ83DRAFT_370 [Remersonia thermophila]|uniref:RRM domain-containing protein n=1 Tax=Remersonia thermophila TaxID=72144 RepID=A0ABR4DKV8_9PEZI